MALKVGVNLYPDKLTLECMSRERLERGKKRLEQLTGSFIRHRADEFEDIHVGMERAGRKRGWKEKPAPDEKTRAMVASIMKQHLSTWPDQRLPALEGKTPREAVATRIGPSVSGLSGLFHGGKNVHLLHGQATELGFACTVGLGPNVLVAKFASDLAKPDGLRWIDEAGVPSVFETLPVKRLWGTGSHTEEKLRATGIATGGELGRALLSLLVRRFGVFGSYNKQFSWVAGIRISCPGTAAPMCFFFFCWRRLQRYQIWQHGSLHTEGTFFATGQQKKVLLS